MGAVRNCDSDACQLAQVRHELARDQLVQAAADIGRALDSRNQNGVVAGIGGGGIAAGAGLIGSSESFSRTVGLFFIAGAFIILVISAGRALLDHRNALTARGQCRDARKEYLAAKEALMATCPHECWPVFSDVACQ